VTHSNAAREAGWSRGNKVEGGFIQNEFTLLAQMPPAIIDKCQLSIYKFAVIASFRHKALRRFFETGDRRGLNAEHCDKISFILAALEASSEIEGMDLPPFRLHPLLGDLKGYWAVTVRANWRIIFRFEDGKAFDIDLVDYH
jgi:proteic killer suppression protein